MHWLHLAFNFSTVKFLSYRLWFFTGLRFRGEAAAYDEVAVKATQRAKPHAVYALTDFKMLLTVVFPSVAQGTVPCVIS